MKTNMQKLRWLAMIMAASHSAEALPPRSSPVVPAPMATREYPLALKDAALSGWHSVLLLEDGTLRCTGSNEFGECEPPAGLTDLVQVVAGRGFSAARSAAGKVTLWGREPPSWASGPAWPTDRTVRLLATGGTTLAAVMDDGSLWASSPIT